MNQLDLIILVVYTITVVLVLQRAIASMNKMSTIAFNKDSLQEALKGCNLSGRLGISFALPGRYPLAEQPKALTVVIANKLERAVFVDWDRSTFTDARGRSRRVIRLSPYKDSEMSISSQVFSPIPPGQVIQETITAEDALVKDGSGLKPKKPLVSVKKLEEGETIGFSLWLVLRLQETEELDDRTCILPCEFIVQRCPWTDSLPF
ncbi:MAG: hypothetical protein WBA10_00450 [Elainellaceae cyanobacterium]